MGYAVYHTEKGKISSGGIGKHIDREPGAEHTYQHSDPSKRNLNQSFAVTEHCKKPLHQAISDRISEGYNHRNKAGELKAIRKDAVKYSTHILTGTHEDMKRIEKSQEEMTKWVKANLAFASEEFGKENIVRFVLHRDEKTPHLHVVTVNLTEDGRLSAKEIIGNAKDMEARQDRYAEKMKEFGLERGLKNTGIKHEDAKTYYTRMQQSLDVTKDDKIEIKKGVFSVDFSRTNEKTIERLSSENKALKTANKAISSQVASLEKNKENSSQLNTHLETELQNQKTENKNMIVDRETYEKSRENFIDDVAQRRIFKGFETALSKKIQESKRTIRPIEVDSLVQELYLTRLREANLKILIDKEIRESEKVKEKLQKIAENQKDIQTKAMEKEKETKFKIAVLQTKLELMEKIERREIITKQDIENKAFQGMKKHFPNDNPMEVAAKYGKYEGTYLDHLEERVQTYQQYQKEGYLEEVKQSGIEDLLAMTNPKELQRILKEQEQNQEKRKGFTR